MTNPWRTIILDCHESLGICDNQMIIKRNEDKMAVPVEQIREILITSDKGSISLPLLVKLASQNTKVVFCDAKRTPVSELTGLNLHFESAGKLMDQIAWTERRKQAVCRQIIKMKIARQRDLLHKSLFYIINVCIMDVKLQFQMLLKTLFWMLSL